MSKNHFIHAAGTKRSYFETEMISSNGPRSNGVNGINGCNPSDTNNNLNNKHQKRTIPSLSGDKISSKRKKISLTAEKHGKIDGEDNAKVQVQQHYNILDKLKELYKELKADKSCELNLSQSSFLLDKLVTKEKLQTLMINLYPGNKGYSLAFRPPTSTTTTTNTVSSSQRHYQNTAESIFETPSWLYDNSYLLDALDSEELPPPIIDFCNVHCPHVYYNGNVIAQIRDYRQSYPLDICDIHYVLLKPTAITLWDHMNCVIDASWSFKERTAFESQLVLATASPICLDPSPSIGIAAINSLTEKAPLGTNLVKTNARRFLQVTKNRNNKLEKKTHYHQTSLASHLSLERRIVTRREQKRNLHAPNLRFPSNCDQIEVMLKHIQHVPIPRGSVDWQPKNTERLTFETDRDNTSYRVRVDLFERATSCEVTGQLTLERQKIGQIDRARMCPFKLSSSLAARRYVKEFMGIFTEEGRKFVKITHERETRVGREILEMQTGEKLQNTSPKLQTIPTPNLVPSTSMTSPQPPALITTAPIKLTSPPQRLLAPQQCIVLTQVKQESSGNQVIKNLLNQPNRPMRTNHGHSEVLPIYLQVDQSNLVTNLQFQQLITTPQHVQSHPSHNQDKRNREM